MKKYFFIILLFICSFPAAARHVAGGELFYEYMGTSGGISTYRLTLRLFRDCTSNGPLLENESVQVGVYATGTYDLVQTVPLDRNGGVSRLQLNTAVFPCLVGTVSVCYDVATYSGTVSLKDNVAGYTLSRIGCCRVDQIANLSQASSVGSNYVTRIPGTATLPFGHNNSPQFNVKDTALVCANKKFKLDFGAVDVDGDSLSYSFCDAYTSGSGGTNPVPAQTLQLIPLPYKFPYSGEFPLGALVSINPTTGIISGVAPPPVAPKDYPGFVVNVCITEWRNGKAFTEHRKDFILKVQNCDFVEADLPPQIIQCKDFTVHFENGSTSSAVTSYLWDFGDNTNNTSHNPTVDYTYTDTGRFMAHLSITGPKGCAGSDSTLVIVYPGFTPAFGVTGNCFQNPYQFTDSTFTKYGTVNKWRWDFGDPASTADTSIIQNPKYKYPVSGVKNIELIVSSSKGCIDTARLDFTVLDKPKLMLPFKDTLICSVDSLPIPVGNPGTYSWLPNKNILFANTSTPLVFPKDTTKYFVTLNDNGCVNTDTVTVNVLQFIKVDLGNDSLICKKDIIQLHPVSYALGYQWKSSSGEVVQSVKYPFVQPLVNTKYYVLANLGKCQDRDSITINVTPYPVAKAGPDTVICFGSRIQLHGSVTASNFSWSPTESLLNGSTTSPIVGPDKTTAYILRATYTTGCLKPVSDTILVTVAPPVIANAGRDTATVAGQPLHLVASGGVKYIWSPEIGLNNPSIYNPIAILSSDTDSIRYKVRVYDANGCYADDDVLIKVYRTSPEIFVPSAFTPNGDGRNDILKPITVGISELHYFRVYNRWGQMLFATSAIGSGWDGTYKGSPQPTGTYVYDAEGVDYAGKIVFRKGTVVLIR